MPTVCAEFYPGEIVDVVFSMINTGQHPITVDGISATLYYHLDARYAIQNVRSQWS